METLTIEDMDMYSQISRRVMKEDLYSIVDSSFMPSGIECDQYSVIGEIRKIEEKKNQITKEIVYDLTLECSDMIFHVGIAKKDLIESRKSGADLRDRSGCRVSQSLREAGRTVMFNL